jgi:hypothetical protein
MAPQLAYFDRSRGPVTTDIGLVLDVEDMIGGKVCALVLRARLRGHRRRSRALQRRAGDRLQPGIWTRAWKTGTSQRPGTDSIRCPMRHSLPLARAGRGRGRQPVTPGEVVSRGVKKRYGDSAAAKMALQTLHQARSGQRTPSANSRTRRLLRNPHCSRPRSPWTENNDRCRSVPLVWAAHADGSSLCPARAPEGCVRGQYGGRPRLPPSPITLKRLLGERAPRGLWPSAAARGRLSA